MASAYSLCFAAVLFLVSYFLSVRFRSLQAWPAFWLTAIGCMIASFLFGVIPTDLRPLTAWPLEHSNLPEGATLQLATDSVVVKVGLFANLRAQLNTVMQTIAPFWLLLYLAGTIVNMVALIFHHLKVRSIIVDASVIQGDNKKRLDQLLATITDASARKYLQHSRIQMLTTSAVHSPFVVCLPRPTLVVSATALTNLTDAQLALVLEHEVIHLANRDPLLLTFTAWLSSLLWFNPFVQQLRKHLKLSIELNCDQKVLANNPRDKNHYLSAILSIVNARNNSSLKLNTAAFGGSTAMFLKRRILRMQDPICFRTSTIVGKLGLLLSFAVIIVANSVLQPFASAQSSTQPETLVKQLQTEKPVQEGRVTSKYGPRKDPFTKEQRVHNGIDYAANNGVSIVATADGQIVFADEKGDYGLRIDIDHGNNISTLYANLGEILVKQGQQVKQGEIIATMGVSGRSTGPHVHYEVHRDGRAICPSDDCAANN